jgi:subtilisin family serine protease
MLMVLLLQACATVPAGSGDPAVTSEMRADADRLILLTVANPIEAVAVQAGSTLHGYDVAPTYTVGAAARAAVAAVARDYRLTPVAAWPITPLKVHCAVFQVAADDSRDAVLARLAQDRRVELAQPLQSFTTLSAGYNDPYFGLQRGFARIDAAQAQQWSRGAGVRVVVIDTGLDTQHPDLQGRIEAQRNLVDDDARQFDADRHGTEVAGVIAADANNSEGIVGVAPAVHIIVLKACWQLQPGVDGAQCNSFTLAKALTVAIESGAQVVNLSLGGPADPLLTQLLQYAVKRGVVVVGAVPPDGRTDGFPVQVPGVIAVDAADSTASAHGVLRAPGREILTLTPGGHYDFVSGSSLAAAHVSGAAALLLSQDPGLSAPAIALLLDHTSSGDAGGAKAINVCAALAALRSAGSCTQQAIAQ